MQLNYIVLGQRIQKIRKSKHISQAVLSAMIDKSAGYISYLECGTKVMSLETFVSIANALVIYALSDFLIMILSWLVKQSLRAFLFQEVQL